MKKAMEKIGKVAKGLAIVGAIAWGSVGIFQVNPVEVVLGAVPVVERIVYGVVGVSGVYLIYDMFQ